jgi:hypothetical protein
LSDVCQEQAEESFISTQERVVLRNAQSDTFDPC